MFRAAIVAAIAGLILWQSQCFQVRDGMIVNRCGLWQWSTGTEIVFTKTQRTQIAAPAVQPASPAGLPHATPMPSYVIIQRDSPGGQFSTSMSSAVRTFATTSAVMDFGVDEPEWRRRR